MYTLCREISPTIQNSAHNESFQAMVKRGAHRVQLKTTDEVFKPADSGPRLKSAGKTVNASPPNVMETEVLKSQGWVTCESVSPLSETVLIQIPEPASAAPGVDGLHGAGLTKDLSSVDNWPKNPRPLTDKDPNEVYRLPCNESMLKPNRKASARILTCC